MEPMEIISAYWAQIMSMKIIKSIISWFVLSATFLIGDINLPVIACAILYLADMILGITINAYRWTFSWIKLRKGIYKFLLYWGTIIVAHMLDLIFVHTTSEFGARYVMIIYLGVTEGLSVLKQFASLGLNIPLKIINRLEGIRDELDSPWLEPTKVSPMIVTETNQSSNTTSPENQSA